MSCLPIWIYLTCLFLKIMISGCMRYVGKVGTYLWGWGWKLTKGFDIVANGTVPMGYGMYLICTWEQLWTGGSLVEPMHANHAKLGAESIPHSKVIDVLSSWELWHPAKLILRHYTKSSLGRSYNGGIWRNVWKWRRKFFWCEFCYSTTMPIIKYRLPIYLINYSYNR